MDLKLIGTTKVTKGWRIALVQAVAKELNAEIGDILLFYKKGDEIVIKKG